jgi:hypothetical protein
MKSAAEVRKGNRERARKHREKVRSQKVFEGLSDVKTLAQGADFMNRISRSAYCPLNGEPCDAQECCKKRREKSAETWKDARHGGDAPAADGGMDDMGVPVST